MSDYQSYLLSVLFMPAAMVFLLLVFGAWIFLGDEKEKKRKHELEMAKLKNKGDIDE